MNRALLIACFALSAIALALSLVPRDAPLPPPSSSAAGEVTLDDLDVLQRRIDAVEDTNRDLLNKVVRLERAGPALAMGGDAGVPPTLQLEVAQLRDEVHGMIAGEALNSPGGKTWLKDQLHELQAEEQKARMEERLARAAQSTEQQKAQWKKFVGDAKLNYSQEQALMQALDAETKKRDALMAEVRAGTKEFGDVFRERRDLQRETDKGVKAQLDEAQSKQYDQLRREQRRDGFGGTGRGGDGQRESGGGGRRERGGP